MPRKGSLKAGHSVKITFTADISNSDAFAMLTGWIPTVDGPDHESKLDVIQPGLDATHEYIVPETAKALRITINRPGISGSGTLSVLENNVLKHSESLSKNTTVWLYTVRRSQ